MSTPTDLSGMLWDDDDNLEQRLRDLIGQGVFKKPFKIYGSFKHDGTSSWPRVFEFSGEHLAPAGVRNLVEKIEEAIGDKLGPDPIGVMRVRAYEDRNSKDMPLTFTRTLRPDLGSLGRGEDPWKMVATLRGENAELRGFVRDLVGQMVASKSSSDTLAAESVKQVAQLGSVRAGAAAAADVSGLSGILTLIAIAIGVPVLRRAFDLPANASLSQIVTLLQLRMESALSQLDGGPSVSPPAGARPPAQLEDPEEEAPDAAPAEALDLDDLLGRIKADDDLLNQLKSRVMADPDLLSRLVA